MFTKKLMVGIVGAALSAIAVVAQAGLPSSNSVVAREAGEGPRGADNEKPGDRQRRGGRRHSLSPQAPAEFVIARESDEGPRGEGKGHPLIDTSDVMA
jgi:hypothetical protein